MPQEAVPHLFKRRHGRDVPQLGAPQVDGDRTIMVDRVKGFTLSPAIRWASSAWSRRWCRRAWTGLLTTMPEKPRPFCPGPRWGGAFLQAVGQTPARILIINAPGHLHEAFLTRTGKPVADATTVPQPPGGPPDVARIVAVAAEVGMVLVPPADAVH